jgi:hypothetical protein
MVVYPEDVLARRLRLTTETSDRGDAALAWVEGLMAKPM